MAFSQPAFASLPSSAPRWKHDVFLSFRGVDTRRGIATDLYHELENRGIRTFMDDQDLVIGTPISPSLLMAIEGSRFAVIVLSRNYASSPWCLEELTKIVQCMDDQHRILPLFYDVEPTDVRHQKKSYEVAFIEHEEKSRHDTEKVNQWRAALKEVANLSGWDSKKYKSDRELVKDIVQSLWSKLRPIEYEFAMSTGDFQAFEATRHAMYEVMKALKDDQVTVVGVYGMGGVGKTTMVKHVAAQARKYGIFNQVTMAVVSQSPDLGKIQGALADMLGVQLEGGTEIGRAASLNKEIMRKKNILIILDDIWEVLDLSRIGIPSYKELQNDNSKVLLTARIRKVCHDMKCQQTITLNLLSKQDSWTLFVGNVGWPFESSTFEDVARRVAGECCGLPIALIAVARALGDKDLVEWEKAARRLEKSQTPNPGDKGDVFECIKLSYDYLKDEDSKSCFLLCCLFPEDYDIKIEDLFKYAIGKGLFRDADTIEEARGTADSVVKYLKNCSLLLDSEEDRCIRMHDIIRDTAMNIAKSEDGFLVQAGSGVKDWLCPLREGYSAISLMKNKIRKLPEELVCPKLQILLLQENVDLNQIPENFFQSPNELRVLDLSRTSISVLPLSFSLLTNLQVLYLDSCQKIIDISILGNLKKLEILSMRDYPLKELSREIGHLTNLRVLEVSAKNEMNGGIVIIPSKVISKLHRLEELYMRDCGFEDWGSKVVEGEGEETNIDLDELTGLSHLKILQVCICDAKCIPKYIVVRPNWISFDIHIGRFTPNDNEYKCYLNYLQLVNSTISTLPRSLLVNTTITTLPDWFVNVVTEKTVMLSYKNDCEGLSNIVKEYDHGRLHGLKYLAVFGPGEELKELMNTTTRVKKEPVFENLEQLHLRYLYCLKELCVGELPLGSLINLKILRVSNCPNLGNVLLPSKLLHRLPNLEVVYVSQNSLIHKLEYVFGCKGFEPKHSKLRELKLVSLGSVTSICNGPAPRAIFQTLKSLVVFSCMSLGSLFTFDAAQCLFQLEDLIVEYCYSLERVIEARKETVNNEMTVLPKLKNLVLRDLPKLYSGGSVDIVCPSLEHIFLIRCGPPFSIPCVNFFGSRNCVKVDDFGSRNCVKVDDVLHYAGLHRRLHVRSFWGA